jgi:hypothetical protein
MDRIDTRDVRPFVQIKDGNAGLQRNGEPLRINLLWQERWGGTFGPQSSSFATRLRRNADFNKKPLLLHSPNIDINDRGQRPAWIMYFACPTCDRRCRVLYSLKGRNEYGCGKCNRPAWESNTWPYTGRRKARGVSALERARLKHEYAARRLRGNHIGQPAAADRLELAMTGRSPLRKPARMSQNRFDEISHKIRVHEQLAIIAQLKTAQLILRRAISNERARDKAVIW